MKAFLSYHWESEAHKDWVRHLADALIGHGVDTTLDQYDLPEGADRFTFMESAVRDADCVICVCTPGYVDRANRPEGCVGVETMVITPQFFDSHSSKLFVPIVRRKDPDRKATPDYL